MNKEIKDQWVAELRDPKYLEHQGIYFLYQLSQNSTERWNPEGALDEVLQRQPDYAEKVGHRITRTNVFVRVAAAPPRMAISARALVLSVDGERSERANEQLPQVLAEYAGLPDETTALRGQLRFLTSQQKPFSEIADFIEQNF